MNKYRVVYSEKVLKQIRKMDRYEALKIKHWIERNLICCGNPHSMGKALKGNLGEYWRYRVGCYRIIAHMDDQSLEILLIEVGHRKEIYD